jgi:Helicase conserved C-terminal domain
MATKKMPSGKTASKSEKSSERTSRTRDLSPVQVREEIVNTLSLDLVGPSKGSKLTNETLPKSPHKWYLTGFLVPQESLPDDKIDPNAEDDDEKEELESARQDDEIMPEPAPSGKAHFPSSIGISCLLPKGCTEIKATVRWGDYRPESSADFAEINSETNDIDSENVEQTHTSENAPNKKKKKIFWVREEREETVLLKLSGEGFSVRVPNEKGLELLLVQRNLDAAGFEGRIAPGTISCTIFLTNKRMPETSNQKKAAAFAFQVHLTLETKIPFCSRPDASGSDTLDWDKRIADLQYHDVKEFAVGHNVAVEQFIEELSGNCNRISTCWLPQSTVEQVVAAEMQNVELGMENLAAMASFAELEIALNPLVAQYKKWIAKQPASIFADQQKDTAQQLLSKAEDSAKRIQQGILLLKNSTVREAFCIANRAMARAARQREAARTKAEPSTLSAPKWRPFQLAFLLLNIEGMFDPTHPNRECVDLLFFPTGGGKTEAYLGLAAFTLVLRRLNDPKITSAGVAVIMRYTLRLLTLDQLGRAAGLICALELERKADKNEKEKKLGLWPFEVGLWVGQGATPNRMGEVNDGRDNTARARVMQFKEGRSNLKPIPLDNCPWCGEGIVADSFSLFPDSSKPAEMRLTCVNHHCDFSGDTPLPIVAVDENIYRRLPCFLIATVDKFASMPFVGAVAQLFGKVTSFKPKVGFFGPCDSAKHDAIAGGLPPPDLIIQDELHLISGPLGTMTGLYETAVEMLVTRTVNNKIIKPKIIASTATVRMAKQQILSLFARHEVAIFPPPGPNRKDSFFARTKLASESPGRLYLGIAAQGRGARSILMHTGISLLAAAQKLYSEVKQLPDGTHPVDGYMTLLSYFNSLRELGGCRRIFEDPIRGNLSVYGEKRVRIDSDHSDFKNREISFDILELTSRVSTSEVATTKAKLDKNFSDSQPVDVALATNMISVGLDITRLGLMLVYGQPKTTSEYIQATSRVGRNAKIAPGLVVTLLNVAKHRDRSHYERFGAFHQSFYRSVEATSVTPFSPRALDRGLAGTYVALARHLFPELTAAPNAVAFESLTPDKKRHILQIILNRAQIANANLLSESTTDHFRLEKRIGALADAWCEIAHNMQANQFQYGNELKGESKLLRDFLDSSLEDLGKEYKKFRANRSLRDVEPSVNVWVRTLSGDNLEE